MSKSKRELREQRLAAERAAAATESRRRRLRRLLGASGLAVVLVAVGIAVSAQGGAAKPVEATSAAQVVAGVPERNGVLGDPDAPVTLTEYVDPQCPICAEASRQVIPDVVAKYVRTGKVKLEMKTMSFLGPDSVRAAHVAAGAAQQGKLWAFMETLYANQGTENSGYVTDDFLTGVADAAGVDAGQALDFAGTQAAQTPLDAADADAQALGVDSTPSFTVKRGDGAEKVVAVGLDDLQAKLDAALAR
jgi:protein-disulfide isomerase